MGEGVSALREFELKFEVSKSQLDRLLGKCALTDLSIGDPIENTLRSIYYDTDNRLLKANGISLRVRQIDDHWVQTLKVGRGVVAGLSQPIEIERPIACGRLELDALGGKGIAADFKELLGDADLQPLFETVITRTTRQLRGGGGSRIEIAFDKGTVQAGDTSDDIHEIEMELKSGDPSSLFRVAQKLAVGETLRFSTMTKAERGYSVVDGKAKSRLAAKRIQHPVLKKNCTVEDTFSALMRAYAGQISHNWKVVLDTSDIEGPHQLRIGLRRFRSLLKAFPVIARRKRPRRLEAEAKGIAALVGELRDLDVLSAEIVAAAIDKHPDDASLVALQDQLDVKRQQVRDRVEAELAGDRMVLFLLQLGQMIEAPKWRAKPKQQQMATGIAAAALDKSWARVAKWGRRIDTLSIPERHHMRKTLKRLRYQVEAFEGFCPNRTTGPFIKKLKGLQDVFGYLNDVAMAEKLSHLKFDDGLDEKDLQRATGKVLKLHISQSKKAWRRARRAWDALDKSGPFWVK